MIQNKYSVDRTLNGKVSLWKGDIKDLDIDIIECNIDKQSKTGFSRINTVTLLETVRSFLETNKASVDRIVFCMDTDEQMEIYELNMTKYFPIIEAH
ncbi:hypothetical protein LSH36_142g07009 [Paralvinella palmiformis]|uniref:Uncharacterized protein n=1 Tax=Paralvinella palmiformis TaxID=53620 RepID=A0AAD9JV46_9ANNE|nr:hypothetical protein LSH36_142g07009 [Paralvinella palmiformis]